MLDLLCGERVPALPSIVQRYEGSKVTYVTADTCEEIDLWKKSDDNLVYEHHSIKLNFDNSENFRRQLQEIAKGRKFDEIHLHLSPQGNPKQHVNEGTEENMAAVAEILKPGGRLYHMIDHYSPLLALDIHRAAARGTFSDFSSGKMGTYYERQRQIAEGVVSKTGLNLNRFGIITGRNPYKIWLGNGANSKLEPIFARLIEYYTQCARYATHFLIATKPKTPVRPR